MFRLVQQRRYYFIFSGVLLAASIAAMVYSTVNFGAPVRLSIDFRGGSLFVVKFDEAATEDDIRSVYTAFGQDDPVVQQLGDDADNRWQIRAGDLTPEEQTDIITALDSQVAPVDRGQSVFDIVDPSIGREVTTAAILAVVFAIFVVLGFIYFAFRRIPNPLRYGACAIAAMLHDVLITMGIMALMGVFFGWEADALFLTALLTVVGFSVQDSIVVFDRIRENLPRYRNEDYETVVNRSLLETVHRSLATQINAIFVLIAVLLFGGATVQQFVAILLIGLLSGTYSSIFTAVPLLVAWEQGELPFIGPKRSRASATA